MSSDTCDDGARTMSFRAKRIIRSRMIFTAEEPASYGRHHETVLWLPRQYSPSCIEKQVPPRAQRSLRGPLSLVGMTMLAI
jgi:hypothetical protein